MSSFTDLNIPIQDSNTNKEILLSLADCKSSTAFLGELLKWYSHYLHICIWPCIIITLLFQDGYECVAFNHEVKLAKKVQVFCYIHIIS